MTRTFIQTTEFTKKWEQIGFNEEDLRRLQIEILQNPKAGSVIRGTGKLRKMRFPYERKGKSGSARVCYVDFVVLETIYLITAYSKKEKDNLSKLEQNLIKKMIETLENSL